MHTMRASIAHGNNRARPELLLNVEIELGHLRVLEVIGDVLQRWRSTFTERIHRMYRVLFRSADCETIWEGEILCRESCRCDGDVERIHAGCDALHQVGRSELLIIKS